MERKNIIIIAVIVAVIAIAAILFSGVLNQTQTTNFNTDFMSGAFVGNAVEIDSNDTNVSYGASYHDDVNNISYNITTMDNSSALMEIYQYQGVSGPEQRSYNGYDWNIYFAQTMPVINNETNETQESMGIVICESQQESQGYVIYIIFEDLSKVNFTSNTFGESYINFVEPLLNSVSLKQSDDVPAIYELFGLSEDEFYNQIEIIHQINHGNNSAQ